MLPIPAKPAFNPNTPAPYWINAAQVYNGLRLCLAPTPLTIAAMANTDMEAAFRTDVIGDDDTAFNLWQWHWKPRGQRILEQYGVDVRSERSIKKICAALWWELNTVYPEQLVILKAFKQAGIAARYFCTQIEGAGALDAAARREEDAELLDVWVARNQDFIAKHPAQ